MEIEPVSSYGLGYAARTQGVPKEKNPFNIVGSMHGKWLKGWDHADQEIVPKKETVVEKVRKIFPLRLLK